MKQRLIASALFALLSLFATPSFAQSSAIEPLPGGCGTGNITNGQGYLTEATNGTLCVNASVAVGGFTPGGTFATITAAGTSGSVALPVGSVVAFQNTGTTTVSCTLGIGSATALANEIQIPASSTVFVTPGSNTWGACIDQTGSTSNTVVLAGGSGLGTGFGGGGGSGGGGAVTLALGAVSSGAYSSGSIASGAFASGAIASGAVASGAFASGSIASGAMVDLGSQADSVCGTATGTCSLIALAKYLNNAAVAGVPYTPATTPTTNTYVTGTVSPVNGDLHGAPYADISAWVGTALGAPSNFGTTPGAVEVPGVNASLFMGTAIISATNGIYSNLLQGNAVISATNGLFSNQLQGNAVLSATNPTFTQLVAGTAGGWTYKTFVAANSDNATNLKNAAGIVHAVQLFGISAATPVWLKFYDKSSSPTCASDTIVKQILIPAASLGSGAITSVIDTQFTSGISYCVVAGIATNDDTSVAAATYVVNIDYK